MLPNWLNKLRATKQTRLSCATTLAVVAGISIMTIGTFAEAAKVTKVKGKTVLIDVESSDIQEGQKYFAIVDGKKKAVILIKKVKGGSALGAVTKGKATVDASLEPTKPSATADSGSGGGGDASADSGSGGNSDDLVLKKKKSKKSSASALYIGALVGYSMDSQTLPDISGNATSMKGSGYSLKAFGDLPISGGIGAIGRFGIEQFNVSGNSPVMGAVTSSIMYLTADALVRYQFMTGTFVPFLAAGVGIHFPLSKSSTILNVPQISTTTVFFLEGGFNYALSNTKYVQVVADYGLFPPSNNVSTNLIALRLGMGFRF